MKFIDSDVLVFCKDLLEASEFSRQECVEVILKTGALWTLKDYNNARQKLWSKLSFKDLGVGRPLLFGDPVIKAQLKKFKKGRNTKINAIDDIFFLLEYGDLSDIKIFTQSVKKIPWLPEAFGLQDYLPKSPEICVRKVEKASQTDVKMDCRAVQTVPWYRNDKSRGTNTPLRFAHNCSIIAKHETLEILPTISRNRSTQVVLTKSVKHESTQSFPICFPVGSQTHRVLRGVLE